MKKNKYLILALILSATSNEALAKVDCIKSPSINSAAETKKIETALATGNPSTWAYTEIPDVYITRAVEALPCIVNRAMKETGVPGIAVAVVRADEVLLARGFGVREVGKLEKVTADTVFQVASLSKPVGATVISRAVSNGLVSWNDPVVKYLPWFRIGDDYVTQNVSIADMYSHRSGLPDHAGDELEDLGFDREYILRRLSRLPLGLFRAQYAYTNFGITAGAEAMAAAHKLSWEQLSDEVLYKPAGMNSTSSRYADYLSAANRAVTHKRFGDTWSPGPPRNPQPQSPAGGVSSTAHDMARWMQLQLGNGTLDGVQLIKPDVLQIMRQPHNPGTPSMIPAARSSGYGLGIGTGVDGTGHVRWSHSGAFVLGAATNVIFIPAADIAIVVLSNGEPHGIPESIAAAFIDIVETGREQRDWLSGYGPVFDHMYANPGKLAGKKRPLKPEPVRLLSRYVGTYKNDYFGPAEISLIRGELVMALGPVPYTFELTHWGGNVFSYLPRGENAVGIATVTFDPDNRTIRIENLDEFGLGTFVKQAVN